MSGQGVEDLPSKLRDINQLDQAACIKALTAIPGITPPPCLRAPTLRRLLAYEVQAKALGGLGRKDQQLLKAVAQGKSPPQLTSPGTHLVRDWNGGTYRVEVVEDGFVFDGTFYSSLSAVARRITGTAWSGPRFFGLTAKRSP